MDSFKIKFEVFKANPFIYLFIDRTQEQVRVTGVMLFFYLDRQVLLLILKRYEKIRGLQQIPTPVLVRNKTH
jgi:hypothetical protein